MPQNLLHQIKEYEDIFTVDTATLKKVVDHFVKELEKGERASFSLISPARRDADNVNAMPRSQRRGW